MLAVLLCCSFYSEFIVSRRAGCYTVQASQLSIACSAHKIFCIWQRSSGLTPFVDWKCQAPIYLLAGICQTNSMTHNPFEHCWEICITVCLLCVSVCAQVLFACDKKALTGSSAHDISSLSNPFCLKPDEGCNREAYLMRRWYGGNSQSELIVTDNKHVTHGHNNRRCSHADGSDVSCCNDVSGQQQW